LSNATTRKVTWVDPDGGDRKPGIIRDFDPVSEIHFVNLDDGGEAEALIHELEFTYVPVGPGTLNTRNVIWINRNGGARKKGVIIDFDPTSDSHVVHLNDGGYANTTMRDLEFIAELSQIDMERIAAALDGGSNMLSGKLKAENRARIFTAIETCTHEDWVEARSSCVHGSETLWQAVIRVHGTCRNSGDTPGREQMISALETKPDA
jgi:hypothetical protein